MSRKIRKIAVRSGIFVVSLMVATAGAYFVTPKKVRTINLGNSSDIFDDPTIDNLDTDVFTSFLNNFVSKVGVEADDDNRTYYGLKVSTDDFKVSFDGKNSSIKNTITLDLDVDFMMKGLKDINFNVYLNADYNNIKLPVQISYVDNSVYFGLKDLNIKCSSTNLEELHQVVDQFFCYGEDEIVSEDGQKGLNLDLFNKLGELTDGLIGNLLGSVDLSNMSGALDASKKDEAGFHLLHDEEELANGYKFTLQLIINKEEEKDNNGEIETVMNSTIIPIEIYTDKSDDFVIQKVSLPETTIGKVTFGGNLNLDFVENYKVYAPDNENYAHYSSTREFHEVLGYKGWIKKLANFLNEDNQKFSIDFGLDLSHNKTVDSVTNVNEIGSVNGSVTVDFSELIDLSSWKNTEKEPVDPEDPFIGHNRLNLQDDEEVEEKSTLEKILEKTSFGIDVDLIGQNDREYANLSVRMLDGDGYISFNEQEDANSNKTSVFKAKVELETINWLVNELPGMIASLSTDEETSQSQSEEAEETLFSFITDSTFVRGIKDGNYSVVLDLISSIRNDESKIYLDIDLSSIGLGNESSVNIVLDGSMDSDKEIFSINAQNIAFGSFNLGLNVKNDTSFSKDISLSEVEKGQYESTSFLPTVFDQVAGILDSKQAGFSIDGSLLDNNGLGVTFDGEGQFDYGEKFGFGNLTIDQYKYHANQVWYSHKIALDVDNQGADYTQNNARFIYGDPNTSKNMKGRFTIQTFIDIFDVISTFIKKEGSSSKFTKFVGPLLETLGLGAISDILDSEDYLRFLNNDILKEIKQYNDGNTLRITVGGAFFGLPSDIILNVNFKRDEAGNRTIDNIALDNLVIKDETVDSVHTTKTLNLNIGLNDYDNEKTSVINKNDDFMDLSDIAVLLKLGINTTRMNYYHLTAAISLEIPGISLFTTFDFDINVHIVVDGKNVKIYGIIADSKITSLAQDYTVFNAPKKMKSEFTFRTDASLGNDVGGYFDFVKTKTYNERVGFLQYQDVDHVYHYRTTSKNMLEGDNLLTYLLVDFLDFKASLLDTIGSLDLSSDEEKEAGDFTNLFTETGFNYNKNSQTLTTGINLYELVGIDALNALELSLYGATVQDENGNDVDVLTRAKVRLDVKALFLTIKVNADIKLVDPDFTATTWANSIEARYKLIAIDAPFNNKILNDPNSYYSTL